MPAKRRLALVVLVMGAVVVYVVRPTGKEVAPPPATTTPQNTARVTPTVSATQSAQCNVSLALLARLTGQGIQGIRVTMAERELGMTNSQGVIEFCVPQEWDGVIDLHHDSGKIAIDLKIPAGLTHLTKVIELDSVKIQGLVLDQDGQPLPATVQVLGLGKMHDGQLVKVRAQTSASTDGRYELNLQWRMSAASLVL